MSTGPAARRTRDGLSASGLEPFRPEGPGVTLETAQNPCPVSDFLFIGMNEAYFSTTSLNRRERIIIFNNTNRLKLSFLPNRSADNDRIHAGVACAVPPPAAAQPWTMRRACSPRRPSDPVAAGGAAPSARAVRPCSGARRVPCPGKGIPPRGMKGTRLEGSRKTARPRESRRAPSARLRRGGVGILATLSKGHARSQRGGGRQADTWGVSRARPSTLTGLKPNKDRKRRSPHAGQRDRPAAGQGQDGGVGGTNHHAISRAPRWSS